MGAQSGRALYDAFGDSPYLLGLIVLYILGLKMQWFPCRVATRPVCWLLLKRRLLLGRLTPLYFAGAGHRAAGRWILGAGHARYDGNDLR